MTFNQWFYSADHRAKYDTDHPAYLAAREAWEAKPLTELQQDAANLLFALHDAWPYVHQWCTIESNKKRIQTLMRKHGDFADLLAHPQEPASDSTLEALARRCLWIAYCWNDHNFEDAAHTYARKEAEEHGIHTFEQANRWITAHWSKT